MFWTKISASLHALLLFISPVLVIREEHAVVSSNITFFFKPCERNGYYKIHHNNVNSYIYCNSETPQISEEFKGRLTANKFTGQVTIQNVVKSDGGLYTLVYKNGNGDPESSHEIGYVIHDAVRISELSRNDTNKTISLTVGCAGHPGTIIWTYNGSDLSDGHRLSDDNHTLTILYDDTGVFTVNVYNQVSSESKNIFVIKDLSGDGACVLGPEMYRNTSKVKWSDGGDRPDNKTLILPRNATNICVLIMPGNGVMSVIFLLISLILFVSKRHYWAAWRPNNCWV